MYAENDGDKAILYSFDNKTYTETAVNELTANLDLGQKLYLKAKTTLNIAPPGSQCFIWCFEYGDFDSNTRVCRVNVSGNIMSLLDGQSFSTMTAMPEGTSFHDLFAIDTNSFLGIVDASKLVLPATTLQEDCYSEMFYRIYTLEHAPKVLPASHAPTGCYDSMFYDCTSLKSAPAVLAETYDCWQDERVPENSPFAGMFYPCTEISSLHFSKKLADSSEFLSFLSELDNFGAKNATVSFDA